MSIQLPQGFGYVGAALLSTVFLLLGQSAVVSNKRSKANIAYPQMYAEKAEEKDSKDALIFNCAQRAHQNTLEYMPMIQVVTLITGLQYPIPAASACALWSISRLSYTRGYITGEPKKREGVLYRIGGVGMLGSLLASVYVVGGWVLQDLGRN